MKIIKNKFSLKTFKTALASLLLLVSFFAAGAVPGGVALAASSSASQVNGFGGPSSLSSGSPQCGSGQSAVKMTIDIGCRGASCKANNSTQGCNAILDATFAIIRIMSDGVGLIVIGSIVYAGIQYSTSRGDPNKTKEAITRIRNTLISLLVYIFAYAILNYVLPAGFFAS